jgi:hypothetical protein
MTVSTQKMCSIAAILVVGLLAIAETAIAPTHAFEADGQHPASKTFSKGFAPNRLLGIGFRRGFDFVEEKDEKKGRRVMTASSQKAAEKAFSDTWSAASATEFGDGVGGDYSSGDNQGSAGSSFGWPGGMAGNAGPGITGPRGGGDGNGQGGSPRRGEDPVSVPEPMTLALVGFGCAAIGVFRLCPLELARRRSDAFRR